MWVAIDKVDRLIVVVIVGVFMMVADMMERGYTVKEYGNVVAFRYIQLGYTAAPQTEVFTNVATEQSEFSRTLPSRQDSNAVAVLTDDMWLMPKIIVEIA